MLKNKGAREAASLPWSGVGRELQREAFAVSSLPSHKCNDDDDKRYRECTISDHEDDNGDSNNDRC